MDEALVCYFTKRSVTNAEEVAKYAGLHVAFVKTRLPPATNGNRLDPETLDDYYLVFTKIPVDAESISATLKAKGVLVEPDEVEIRV